MGKLEQRFTHSVSDSAAKKNGGLERLDRKCEGAQEAVQLQQVVCSYLSYGTYTYSHMS